MVGLATRASNNHINLSVFGDKGSINSLGLQYRQTKAKKGNRNYTGAEGTISDH